MEKKQDAARRQYAALPYRKGPDGVEVMLVTSRETRRWIIPKGWPLKRRKPHAAAEREAYEEAGVVGEIAKQAIGSYSYDKRLKVGAAVTCQVDVFPLEVRKQLKKWPEQAQRDGRWFKPDEAARAVQEPELGDLIRRVREFVDKPAPGA